MEKDCLRFLKYNEVIKLYGGMNDVFNFRSENVK